MARAVAKLFKNGGSQAVRLPADCRFPGASEVYIHREGDLVILEPKDSWPVGFFESFSEEDVIERPKQQPIRRWSNPFGGTRKSKRPR